MRIDHSEPDSLSVGRKLGFGLGDYGLNLYWQTLSLFVLFFYTDVLGLPASTAGLIYMVASIWDGLTDPVMGALAERTRTRWGRYRPYLLIASVPLALSFCFLFFMPGLDGFGLTAVVMAGHLLFRTCYTVLSIPFTSLTARITSSARERSQLAGFRMVFASMAGMTVAYTTQPMVAYFGGGDAARGFIYSAAVFAMVATAIFPIVFLSTREPPEDMGSAHFIGLAQCWENVSRNRAFWVVIFAAIGGVMCSTVIGKSILYYYKYFLHDEAGARYALVAYTGTGMFFVPVWVFLSNQYLGKQRTWLVSTVVVLLGLAYFALRDIQSSLEMLLLIAFLNIGTIGIWLTFWSMLPDTVEYGAWRTGVRVESFTFGLGSFAQKVALGLAAGLFGAALDFVGYVPNVEQTPETLAGMKAIIVGFPSAGLIIGGIIMLFYPMGPGEHERLVRVLARTESGPGAASTVGTLVKPDLLN